MDKINLTIDGQTVEVEQGQTVLDAAKALGLEIPTLCHHPAVPPAGACRVCVVEVTGGGRPGLVPACAYPAQDGLEIASDSDAVAESRRMTIELLLARCPGADVIKQLAARFGVEPPALAAAPAVTR